MPEKPVGKQEPGTAPLSTRIVIYENNSGAYYTSSIKTAGMRLKKQGRSALPSLLLSASSNVTIRHSIPSSQTPAWWSFLPAWADKKQTAVILTNLQNFLFKNSLDISHKNGSVQNSMLSYFSRSHSAWQAFLQTASFLNYPVSFHFLSHYLVNLIKCFNGKRAPLKKHHALAKPHMSQRATLHRCPLTQGFILQLHIYIMYSL